jgi:glucosyl-3-phosphoglycerate synthase
MVTVIIPALNEERTIGSVVHSCWKHPQVTEVLVIDDTSTDCTVVEAYKAGADVIASTKRGKGISMKEGVEIARNEVLVFLDADIDPYPAGTLHALTNPVLSGEADFVKATFSRNAGRVTELLAKPLLTLLYPDLAGYSQPLSGMIAGRKMFFGQVNFLDDYGVDIGILIDMFSMGARIREVNIGYIENKSKPWHCLAKMSTEVASAILFKALRHRPDISLPESIHNQPLTRKAEQ